MEYRPVGEQNREAVNAFIKEHWFSTDMAVRGELVDMKSLPGLAAYDENEIAGLATYRFKGRECEILSLDSLVENRAWGARSSGGSRRLPGKRAAPVSYSSPPTTTPALSGFTKSGVLIFTPSA